MRPEPVAGRGPVWHPYHEVAPQLPFEERGRFEEAATAKGYRVTVLRG